MSDKDPESAKNQKAREHLSSGHLSDVVISIDDIRIRHELPRVLGAFEQWCAQEQLAFQGDLLRSSITNFLRRYAAINGDRKLTALSLYPFATALDDFMFSKKSGDFRDMASVIGAYLRFLSTTGTWSGTREEFRRIKSYFDRLLIPEPGPRYSDIPELQAALIKIPRLSGQEALSAVEELDLTSRMRSFLTWFGDKRETTSTKALHRKHVHEAAASLDVVAVDDAETPFIWPRPQNGPVAFKNASHVLRLKLYWDALVGAELIRLSPTRAYLAGRAERFLAGNPDDVVSAVRAVARHMYRSVAEETSDRDTTLELGYLTRYFLLEASVEPLSVEILRHPVRGLADADPRGDPQIIAQAWQRLESLRDEGLVAIGNMLSIPPVLLKPLVLELAKASAVAFEFDAPDDMEND